MSIQPKESKVFLIFLVLAAVLWAGIAWAAWGQEPGALSGFFRVYRWILLDLGLMVFVFWKIFFTSLGGALRKMQLFLAFTFKLVCLGFLVITLKDLRNESPYPATYGVFFIGAGPVIASFAARAYLGMKGRNRGTRI